MRVRCPTCGTEFHLDDDRIPDDGLRARCGVCKNVIIVPSPNAVSPNDPVFVTTQGKPQPPALAHLADETNPTTAEEAASLMIEVAKEQRAMAWQLTQEIFRLREAIDQQHAAITALAKLLSTQSASPANNGEAAKPEQQELQKALDSEREMVEQLEHTRSELEERVTKAEEALSKRGPSGLFDKFLRRRF